MTPDTEATIQSLKDAIARFVAERDWQPFHAPKNLSMSLAIEAAELMEHFQWITVEESRELRHDPDRLQRVGEEVADVICYALALANELQLDVSTALQLKMQKNALKYPVDEYRGRYGPEDVRG